MPKLNLKLVNKYQIVPKVYFLTFLSNTKTQYIPGQFFSLEVETKNFRPYSVCYVSNKAPHFFQQTKSLLDLDEGEYISFMISTKPGGTASQYFENVQTDTEINAIGPSGRFSLHINDKPKVFIATGTGLAPFLPMIHEILAKNSLAKIDLFFGCWKYTDNFAPKFFVDVTDHTKYPNLRIFTVAEDLENQQETQTLLGGRVTTVVPDIIKDFTHTDFYLCGHPAMVTDMGAVLVSNGGIEGENVFMEKFGTVK